MQHEMCGYSIQAPSSAAAISGSHPITNTVIESGPGTKWAANELEPEESELTPAALPIASTASTTQSVASEQKKHKTMVENDNYRRCTSGGTDLGNIIESAYRRNHFKSDSDWSFGTIPRDLQSQQFKENPKFHRCLELFDVATSDENKRKLEEPGLNTTALLTVAMSIADKAMKKLLELENKPMAGRVTGGYCGVGQRVRKVTTTTYRISSSDNITTLGEAIAMGAKTNECICMHSK
jgi:hypothetical protein